MKRVSLILALHNHQPVGNFDWVNEEAARLSYLPTLETWARFPEVPLGLHNSGVLWDWLAGHHPEYLDQVAALVGRGQLELLTGGHYEPILASIPDVDKVGQVRRLSAFLAERFGVDPETLWLTERVWEPGLPAPLAQAGVRSVLVDDEHFHAAGVPHRELAGYFRTEEGGSPVAVFPILKELRYLIPFSPPEATFEFLRGWADESGERLAVLGDDGEKFGVWPKTYQTVFEEGWLRRFLQLLTENRDWCTVTTPGRWLAEHGSRGLVYLPTTSYAELTEWALPTGAQVEFGAAKERFQHEPDIDRFLRGGFWRNFLSKYPESNRMHKRALDLSRRIRELPGDLQAGPLDALWQAQCNCAYWHGVFGGLYLPHLRDAVHRKLQQAETGLDRARGLSLAARELDLFNEEGRAWLLRNDHLGLGISPERGGMLFEWADLRTGHDLGNTLTRRLEAYHTKLKGAVVPGGESGGGPETIHGSAKAKEAGLEDLLAEDWHVRASFLDHLLEPDLRPEEFRKSRYRDLGDFVQGAYAADLDWDRGRVSLELRRVGRAATEPAAQIEITKRYTLLQDEPGYEVLYRVTHLGGPTLDAWLGVEWNVTYLTGEAPDRWADFGVRGGRVRMGEKREFEGVESFSLGDEWLDLAVETSVEPACDTWMFPVETVSLSEAGFERNYQATCLLFRWPLRLAPGETFLVRFEPRHRRAKAGEPQVAKAAKAAKAPKAPRAPRGAKRT